MKKETQYQKAIKSAKEKVGLKDHYDEIPDWVKCSIAKGQMTKAEWEITNSKETQDFLREIGM